MHDKNKIEDELIKFEYLNNKLYLKNDGKINSYTVRKVYIEKNHKDFYNYLINFSNENDLINAAPIVSIWHIVNNIKNIPKCYTCKINNVKWRNYYKGYNLHCCASCATKSDLTQNKTKNTNLKKYGKEYCFQVEEIKDKIKETLLEEYGVDNAAKSEKVQNKTKITNLERYGVEYTFQNKDIKYKCIQTLLSNYNVTIPIYNKDIQNKTKNTNLERYGVEYTFQNKDIKYKCIQTLLFNYGVEYASQNEFFLEKMKITNLERYGVEFPMQNLKCFYKALKTAFNIHQFNNTYLHYQSSYELDFLNKYHNKIKIENGPTIKYLFENNNKIYYPDFYLPEFNLIVEIKSDYIYNLHLESNLGKQKECLNLGYNFIFIINKNYNNFEKIIKL